MIGSLAWISAAQGDNPDDMRRLIDNAGPIAMAFIVILGIAIWLLSKSMRRQLNRIDPALPPGPKDLAQARDRQVILDAMERGSQQAGDDGQAPGG